MFPIEDAAAPIADSISSPKDVNRRVDIMKADMKKGDSFKKAHKKALKKVGK